MPAAIRPIRRYRPFIGRPATTTAGASPSNLSAGSVSTGEAFGSGTLTPQPVSHSAGSVASAVAIGSGTFSVPPSTLSAGSVTTGEAIGSGTFSPRPVALSIGSVGTGEAFGSLVQPGGATALEWIANVLHIPRWIGI